MRVGEAHKEKGEEVILENTEDANRGVPLWCYGTNDRDVIICQEHSCVYHGFPL